MRFLVFALLLLVSPYVFAQQDSVPPTKKVDSIAQINLQKEEDSISSNDSIVKKDSIKLKKPSFKKPKEKEAEKDSVYISDYKIISYSRDTTIVDTTLTIRKEYQYNYLREDDFELMPFANIGQPYNALGRKFSENTLYPQLGAVARHANYFEVEDIAYYNVPTPMTELMFKTTLEQGQLLDALLTFNFTERLNVAIAYKGFRSLGKYRFNQAQSGNFRTSFNYTNKKGNYTLRGHVAAQDLEAEENGGIRNREQFENNENNDFTDRFRIDPRYDNANNRILGKRYYFDQQLRLLRSKDSMTTKPKTSLAIGHEFNYETKFYDFTQSRQEDAFGLDPFVTPIEDRARLKTMFNKGSVTFFNKTLGEVKGWASLYNYNYFFNSILITDEGTIQNQLKGEEIALGGSYKKNFGPLSIKGDINYNLVGDLGGSFFNASIDYKLNDNNVIFGGIHASSRMPNFNYLLYQSDYRNYNWQNTDTFENQQIQNIRFGFDSKKFGRLEAEYSALDNYTYFRSTATEEQIGNGQETAFVRPFQQTETINHLRVKYSNDLKWRRWTLTNTVLYQEVTQDEQVLNLPQLVTRNSLYLSADVFKKAMYLQTGVTFKYFTSYNMNAYNPLLGEFYIQNNEEFGAYPLLDLFINAKVRQTRIYLKAEHLNAIFSEPNYYSAPNYPYRDFIIRFGLVWNFFS